MDNFKELKHGKKFVHKFFDLQEMESVTDADTGRRYYVTPEGYHYDSMTTALKWRSKAGIEAWRKRVGAKEADRISARGRERGDALHDLCEAYLKNDDKELERLKSLSEQDRLNFKKIQRILDRIEVVGAIEKPLYSHRYKLAGRTDCIGVFDGVPSIIDFKTARKTKRKEWITDYFLQATGYSLFLEEMIGVKCEQLVIIIMVDGKPPQVFVEQRKNFIALFDETVKTYFKLKANGEC